MYPLFTTTTTLALLVPFVLLIILVGKRKNAQSPPGPFQVPIIGHLHLLRAVSFRSFSDLAKKYGPLMQLKLGEIPTIIISSPEIAKEVLKEHEPNFADRPKSIAIQIMWYDYVDIAFSPYGDFWKQMRKICVTEFFNPKLVRSFRLITNDEVERLVCSINSSCITKKPINFTEKTVAMISSIACRATLGKVCNDVDEMVRLMKEALGMAAGLTMADLFPSYKFIINTLGGSERRLRVMHRKIDAILDNLIHEHKANLAKMKLQVSSDTVTGNGEFGNEDLVDVLLRVNERQELQFPINNEIIKSVIFDMFVGGTDTTSSTVNWAMTELMRNPRILKKAQDEVRDVLKESLGKSINEKDLQKMNYIKLIVKEVLRLHPTTPLLPRASQVETIVNGYTIPANVKVLINAWAIQRDPKYWTNPESFEPERFENNSIDFLGRDFEFLPFGSGKRMCPGLAYAVSNVVLILARLLYSFDWKLPDGVDPENLDMMETEGLTSSRKDVLFMVATHYDPLCGL